MSRQIRLFPLWLCVALLIAVGALAQPITAQTEPLASLDPAQGVIQYQAVDADPTDPAAWEVITERILVSEGDRIRTGNDALAYLTFFQGVDTEIRANTLVVVSTLTLGDDTPVNVTLDLLLGDVVTNVEDVLDPGDRFEIHTPGATAVVRGTRWLSEVTTTGESGFTMETGTLGVILHAADLADVAAPFDLNPSQGLIASPQGQIVQLLELIDYTVPVIVPDPALLAPADCGDGVCGPDDLALCPVDCLDQLALPACGDGMCVPSEGESLLTCPADCGPYRGEACGNGTCDADESGLTCAQDCAPGEYFGPVDPALCGNDICDPTESALTCAADCALAVPPTGDQPPADTPTGCQATGANKNLRDGPGLNYPVRGVMQASEPLAVLGQNALGDWLVVDYRGLRVWVAARVVTLDGSCDTLPVLAAPPPPEPAAPPPDDTPSDTPPDTPPSDDGATGDIVFGTGEWQACGTCSSCGDHPPSECRINPVGQCVWDPANCGPDTGPDGSLTGPATASCTYSQTVNLSYRFTSQSGATLVSYSVDTSGDIQLLSDSKDGQTIYVTVYCLVPGTGNVFVSAQASDGGAYNTGTVVNIN